MSVAIGTKLHMNLHIVQVIRANLCTVFVNIFLIMPVQWFSLWPFFKFKMAARYHVGSDWYQSLYEYTYRTVSTCQLVYFLRQYISNYASLVTFTMTIFLNSRWRPDNMSVVIGTELHMKLNITKCTCANVSAFDIMPGIMSVLIAYESIIYRLVYSEICHFRCMYV